MSAERSTLILTAVKCQQTDLVFTLDMALTFAYGWRKPKFLVSEFIKYLFD